MNVRITAFYWMVWGSFTLGVLASLMFVGGWSYWFSVASLLWFTFWELLGILSRKQGDTLSEAVWKLLDIREKKPTEFTLFSLFMGAFACACMLAVGLVAGAETREMPDWARIAGVSSLVFGGVMPFLGIHMWRGGNN